MHPNKNILEMRGFSREKLLSQEIEFSYCQKLSRLFKDDFDAYVFIFNLEGNETSTGGFCGVINNQIKGIGMPTYICDQLPTMKRIRGTIILTGLRFLFEGPLLHEICHLYAAPDLGQIQVDSEGNEQSTGGHWGITDIHGQLGGFDASSLVKSGDCYQATCWIASYFNEDYNGFSPEGICRWHYAPLELYLMGLAPISEVPDVHVYKDISETNSAQIYKDGTFTAKKVITYTQDDLIAKWGERVPNYKDSPKELRILPVVLTEKPLSDLQWRLVQEDIEKQQRKEKVGQDWPINFWEATGGRGTIKIGDLDKSLYKNVVANEIIVKSSLRISGGYIHSEKEIAELKVYDWAGRLIDSKMVSAFQIPLSSKKGNILVLKFADGSVETVKY